MVRIPRRIPAGMVCLLAVGALLVVAGCGSAGQPTTTMSTVPLVVPAANPTGPADAFATVIDTPLQPTENTPSEVTSAVEQHRPVVVAFYVTGSTDDAKVVDALKDLEGTYTDVTFLYYDYKAPTTYGDLPILFPVDYPPEVVFIDTSGTIRYLTTGYVDHGTLNQQVVNIRQG